MRLSLRRQAHPADAQATAPAESLPPVLDVGGFVPFSSTDWPGKLAAVVFVQGCPWRCVYCHNTSLQARRRGDGKAWHEVVEVLERRVGLLDAVVFSGGEPTLDAGLPAAVGVARRLGFQVGLHTAGLDPVRLKALLPLVDWVGLDVKTVYADYADVTGVARSGKAASRSLDLVLASGVAHELRTTYHPAVLDDAALLATARELARRGATDWVLQRWQDVEQADLPTSAQPLTACWQWPAERVMHALGQTGLTVHLRG